MRRDDEEPRVGRRRHRRSSGRPRDQRDLAEEVATPERPHFAALALHLRLPVDEDEELPAERSFADELPPGAEVDLIGELRDLREFLLRAARKQWDALDRLNLRVPRERHAASHQSVTCDDDQQSPTTDSACKEFALMRIRPETSPSVPRWTALLELLQSTCYLAPREIAYMFLPASLSSMYFRFRGDLQRSTGSRAAGSGPGAGVGSPASNASPRAVRAYKTWRPARARAISPLFRRTAR